MRFICLHGAGTNSELFESQTAALRYELGGQHQYEFVQGLISMHIAPELASMADMDNGSYYAYYDPSSPVSYAQALDHLEAYVANEGPFDGVLAFSQGATLAAMYLIRKAIQDPSSPAPFKCAIFIAGYNIYDPTAYFEHGEIRILDAKPDGRLIQIPTVHMWGERDRLRKESRSLSELCEPSMAAIFVHEGAHEVPRLSANGALAGGVKAMRRGVTSAMLLGQA